MEITASQQAIKDRLDQGKQAREIANELGITRNAVYQQIQRMRRNGVLDADYTPTGVPVREINRQGALEQLLAAHGDGGELDAGARALALELARVRDELDAISRRITLIVPR